MCHSHRTYKALGDTYTHTYIPMYSVTCATYRELLEFLSAHDEVAKEIAAR